VLAMVGQRTEPSVETYQPWEGSLLRPCETRNLL
jgi:hypothetical protein